ncbi:MAG TPA: GNAT family N-acetyltransferase [Steroidobacteraceae bacterium]|nr:GNAT family N-acetyltransferase [Steroidobacteraceae bacterium]
MPEVRAATLGDLEFIVDSNARIAAETEQRELDRRFLVPGVRALLEDPAKGRYFIAEESGQPLGQLMYTTEWSDWRNGDFWWIQSVYVRQDARRRGIFSLLFRHLEGLARATPRVCGIRLYMEAHNRSAQATYTRLGMVDSGYQVLEVDFRKPANRP